MYKHYIVYSNRKRLIIYGNKKQYEMDTQETRQSLISVFCSYCNCIVDKRSISGLSGEIQRHNGWHDTLLLFITMRVYHWELLGGSVDTDIWRFVVQYTYYQYMYDWSTSAIKLHSHHPYFIISGTEAALHQQASGFSSACRDRLSGET